MDIFKIYFDWFLLLGAAMAVVGFWGYTLELIRGNVTRFTRWSELNDTQRDYASCMIWGGSLFIATLIIGALIKVSA